MSESFLEESAPANDRRHRALLFFLDIASSPKTNWLMARLFPVTCLLPLLAVLPIAMQPDGITGTAAIWLWAWLACRPTSPFKFYLKILASEFALLPVLLHVIALLCWAFAGFPFDPMAFLCQLLSWHACLALVFPLRDCLRAWQLCANALQQAGVKRLPPFPTSAHLLGVLLGIHSPCSDGVDVETRTYSGKLRCDILRCQGSNSDQKNQPMLLFLHGGAWVTGPHDAHPSTWILRRVAKAGWIVMSAEYSLSPQATFPEHLIDCKRALHWLRTRAQELGGNPNLLAVGGESAGAHLAILLALTQDGLSEETQRRLQPGFETADVTVQGVLDLWGMHDWIDRGNSLISTTFKKLLEVAIMKTRIPTEVVAAAPLQGSWHPPSDWHLGSPLSYLLRGAAEPCTIPWLAIHGAADTIIPVQDHHSFYRLLFGESREMQAAVQLPGAHHGFAVLPSLRGQAVAQCIVEFLKEIERRASR